MNIETSSISVLTVEIENCKPYLDVLLDSITSKSVYVKEIIIAVTDAKTKFETCQYVNGINGIKIRRFGLPLVGISRYYHHAYGLHACLSKACSEYVLFSDPDVFWYTDVDKLFLELMKTHDLNYIGVSHHNAVNQGFYFFPYVIHSMAHLNTLPNNDWLKGKLVMNEMLSPIDYLNPPPKNPPEHADGKYLIPGPTQDVWPLYPNKSNRAIFDVGCNLWLWNEEKKGRWLSFQTKDCQDYLMGFNRCNFKPPVKLDNKKLIHHACDSSKAIEGNFDKFKKLYEQTK